jgi:hypothetical protein
MTSSYYARRGKLDKPIRIKSREEREIWSEAIRDKVEKKEKAVSLFLRALSASFLLVVAVAGYRTLSSIELSEEAKQILFFIATTLVASTAIALINYFLCNYVYSKTEFREVIANHISGEKYEEFETGFISAGVSWVVSAGFLLCAFIFSRTGAFSFDSYLYVFLLLAIIEMFFALFLVYRIKSDDLDREQMAFNEANDKPAE